MEPVISVARVKEAPIGALALEIISTSVCLNTIENKEQIAIKE